MKKPDNNQLKMIKSFCTVLDEALRLGKDIRTAEQMAFSITGEAYPRFADRGSIWVRRELLPRLATTFQDIRGSLGQEMLGTEVYCEWGRVIVGQNNGAGLWVTNGQGMVAHIKSEEFVRYNPGLVISKILNWWD